MNDPLASALAVKAVFEELGVTPVEALRSLHRAVEQTPEAAEAAIAAAERKRERRAARIRALAK